MDISWLKDFADFGGVFIVTLVLLFNFNRKFDSIEDKLIKILTILTLGFNKNPRIKKINSILGKDKDKIQDLIS